MAQNEEIPTKWTVQQAENANITATSERRGVNYNFTFELVRPNVFRTTFTSPEHPLPPYPNVHKPDILPTLIQSSTTKASDEGNGVIIRSGDVEAKCSFTNTPTVSLSWTRSSTPTGPTGPLYSDLPFRSYAIDGPGVSQYTTYDRSALHVGLGEKAAPFDLTGRAFRISATDSFGYDVRKTDPLYKHMPLLVTAQPWGVSATVVTSHARGFWSVGCEMDGLWGRYKVYRQDHGGLEQYVIVGRTLRDVVQSYAELAGFPLLVPRWSFGYIAGGYKYTMMDEPIAHKVLTEFADNLEKHEIPCSGFQMSSGYHVAHEEPKVRNVFHWNRYRFPDPQAFTGEYHNRGIRLIANIKPFLLASHPDFDALKRENAFFSDPIESKPGYMRLWSAGGGESGEGCSLDFTSQAAFDFWVEGVRTLRREGIDVMWNDNNEYTLPSDEWRCALEVPGVRQADRITNTDTVGLWGRAMQTELMGRASHEALLSIEPNRRPFILTRSATPGTLRYACSSWSGDNVTSWEGMRGSTALSLNNGISLLQCSGHDIGGFEGPQPSPELLVRWVQLGAYSPRFAINCFKTSPSDNTTGEVIEPWMYPQITHLVRAAIKRRYEIIPYLYSLALDSHQHASPPQRWVGWGYEADPEVWSSRLLKDGETQYWLGDSLLVGGVYEPGATSGRLYLPSTFSDDGNGNDGFVNLNSPYQHFHAGGWADIHSAWDQDFIPVLAKVGGAVPVGKPVQTKSVGETTDPKDMPLDDYRGLEIFPPPANVVLGESRLYQSHWFEDDGISQTPQIARFEVQYKSTFDKILVKVSKNEGSVFVPDWKTIEVILPHGDAREVAGLDGSTALQASQKEDGRRAFTLALS